MYNLDSTSSGLSLKNEAGPWGRLALCPTRTAGRQRLNSAGEGFFPHRVECVPSISWRENVWEPSYWKGENVWDLPDLVFAVGSSFTLAALPWRTSRGPRSSREVVERQGKATRGTLGKKRRIIQTVLLYTWDRKALLGVLLRGFVAWLCCVALLRGFVASLPAWRLRGLFPWLRCVAWLRGLAAWFCCVTGLVARLRGLVAWRGCVVLLMGLLRGSAAWLASVAWLRGLAAWPCCVALLRGFVAWPCCVALLRGFVAWLRCVARLRRLVALLRGAVAWPF